jgi:hypothetical protein
MGSGGEVGVGGDGAGGVGPGDFEGRDFCGMAETEVNKTIAAFAGVTAGTDELAMEPDVWRVGVTVEIDRGADDRAVGITRYVLVGVADQPDYESVGLVGQRVLVEPKTRGGFGVFGTVGGEGAVGESGFATAFGAEAVEGSQSNRVGWPPPR